MSTITKEKTSFKLNHVLNQPYVLTLHNDDKNTFEWVIECLMKICEHDYEQASQSAILVHYTGKCDVKRGDKETISRMYDKLKGAGLTVTMEIV